MIQTNEPIYILTREELGDIIKNAASVATKEAIKQLSPKNDDDLWDADKVGKYLGLSAWTVQYKMPSVRGFPKPLLLGDGPKAPKRWRAGDVKMFAKNRQGR